MFLFVRCTAIDPTDKTSFKKKKKGKSKGILKLNYGFILTQIVVRFFRRLEKKILRTFIRRKYLDPWKTNFQMEPLLPFPLVMKDDTVSPDVKEDDNISYCSLCDFEVCILFPAFQTKQKKITTCIYHLHQLGPGSTARLRPYRL